MSIVGLNHCKDCKSCFTEGMHAKGLYSKRILQKNLDLHNSQEIRRRYIFRVSEHH